MRALFLLLAFALASPPALSQATGDLPNGASGARGPAGLGFAVVTGSDDVILRFYETPEAAQPVHEVSALFSTAGSEQPAWLQPEAWWPDYSLFHLRSVEQREEWVRVVVHEESGRTLWISSDSTNLAVVPWQTYWTEHVTIVERTDIAANPVRTAPAPEAPLAGLPEGGTEADWGGDCLLPVEVRGDWMRVTRSVLCSPVSEEPLPSLGWVRWRDGEGLLVTWGLTC